MPSEKSRYLNKKAGSSPLDFKDLKTLLLPALGVERLVKMLCIRSQWDNLLNKALVASIEINLSNGCWEKAKAAIDYALYFPDQIRYYEHGHWLIINEISDTADELSKQEKIKFALQVASYTLKLGRAITNKFEDDWEWVISLNSLENWIKKAETIL